MRILPTLIGLASLALAAGTAMAAERTVTFTIDKMGSPSCERTVEAALGAVPGVSGLVVSHETKSAAVTFDDEKTSVGTLEAATAAVGYPARPQTEGN